MAGQHTDITSGLFSGQNTLSGKEGRLFLDGEELASIKGFESTIEKTKEDVPIMGRRFMSKKTNGVSGSGTMTFYKVSSRFIELMLQYIETGIDQYFTVQSVLDDKGAGLGTERVTLYNVNFDSVPFGMLDVETASLEEEIPFTFEGAKLPEKLKSKF